MKPWTRSILPVGAVHGPNISGAFIALGGDWIYIMPDGSLRLDVRATIKTDDGELIFIDYGAVAVPNKGATDRINQGETITTKDALALQDSPRPRRNTRGSMTCKRWESWSR